MREKRKDRLTLCMFQHPVTIQGRHDTKLAANYATGSCSDGTWGDCRADNVDVESLDGCSICAACLIARFVGAVALRYSVISPTLGIMSDTGGKRTLWIIGGRSENRVVPHVSDCGVSRLCRRILPYRDDRICDDGSDADTAGCRPWLL